MNLLSRFTRPRIRRWSILLVLLGIALNYVAYRHAWRMTHFVGAGQRTRPMYQLSMLGKLGVLVRGVEIPKPALDTAPPAGTRTVRLMTRDGVQLEAWDVPVTGARGVIVMFHGYATSKSSLVAKSALFRELGWQTVLVDLRGSGGSEGTATSLGWHEARDVAAAARWARHEYPHQRLVLFGESLGAAAVLRAIATENISADGILVESPFDRLVTTVGHRYHAMHLPAFPFAQLLVFWGGIQHGFDPFAHDPVEYARSVACPALVLCGELDRWVKPAEARRVADAMRGPAECVSLNADHGGLWREDPVAYRAVVTAWLAERF